MQIFNIGGLELVFILLIALVVLGPERLVQSARSMGRMVNKIVRSPIWTSVQETSRELRQLPQRIIRDAGLEESLQELQTDARKISGELSEELDETVQATREAAAALSIDERVLQAMKKHAAEKESENAETATGETQPDASVGQTDTDDTAENPK